MENEQTSIHHHTILYHSEYLQSSFIKLCIPELKQQSTQFQLQSTYL